MRDDAGHIEKSSVEFFGGADVMGESPFCTDAFGILCLGFDRGVVNAVGALMQLGCELLADEFGKCTLSGPGEVAYGTDSLCLKTRPCLLADPEKVADSERPHLFRDFFCPECVYLVRLLEIGGHFG